MNEVLLAIKDAMYSSGESLQTIYEKCMPNNSGNLERDHFIGTLMHAYGAPVSENELNRVFSYLAHGEDTIDHNTFVEVLSWEEEFQDVVVLRKIRAWMY